MRERMLVKPWRPQKCYRWSEHKENDMLVKGTRRSFVTAPSLGIPVTALQQWVKDKTDDTEQQTSKKQDYDKCAEYDNSG